MEFKNLSILAESALKYATEEADREFEKIRQKYLKQKNTNTIQLTTSVEEYENSLTELRLCLLKENLDAYFDINPKLYAYVHAVNAKKELDFTFEHNKIHRQDINREEVMKEIATRRYRLEQVEVNIERAKYEKDKFVKEEQQDYQYHIDLENAAKEIIEEYDGVLPFDVDYATFYQQMHDEYERICEEQKQLMNSLFEKVEVLVKRNYKTIALTEEKNEITQVCYERDLKVREALALHSNILDLKVDLKVLKVQLKEKLPVQEDIEQITAQVTELTKKLENIERDIENLNSKIKELQETLLATRKRIKDSFLTQTNFDGIENVSDSEKIILNTINGCFTKETDEVFGSLVKTIDQYAQQTFKTYLVYKREAIAAYNEHIENYKKEQLAMLSADADVKLKNAYALPLDDYLRSLLEGKVDVGALQQEIKAKHAQDLKDAKQAYLAEKSAIYAARLERKNVYKQKKIEAKTKMKIETNSLAKIEIRETLEIYKKEIKEGDKAKYKKARKNYRQKIKQLNEAYKLTLLGINNPQTIVVEKIHEKQNKTQSKQDSVFEKRLNKDLKRQLKLSRYRKNMNKTKRENILGYIFLSVWAIGFVILTLYPLIYTFFLSFSNVGYNLGYDPVFFGNGKLFPNWIGFQNYSNLFFNNTSFIYEKVPTFLMSLAFFLPIVVFIAFVLAMLLNTKIIGKTVFRLIYFLPVIIISGELINMLQNDGGGQNTIRLTIDGTFIHSVLVSISDKAVEYANFVFQNFIIILWMTGVPIVLFISGLQKIDRSLYEAAEIDGANKWQALWAVTFPLIKSVILIACLFTIVQIASIDVSGINPIKSSGGDTANPGIKELMSGTEARYGMAAAMAWIQVIIVLVFVLIVFLIFREKEFVEKQKSFEEVERIKAKKARRRAKAKAFFHTDDIKRTWAKVTGPFSRWNNTRKMKKQKRKEEKGE